MRGANRFGYIAIVALALVPVVISAAFSYHANSGDLDALEVYFSQQQGSGVFAADAARDPDVNAIVVGAETIAAKTVVREFGGKVYPGTLFFLLAIGASLAVAYKTRSVLWAGAVCAGCVAIAGLHAALLHGTLEEILVAMENTGQWGEVTARTCPSRFGAHWESPL